MQTVRPSRRKASQVPVARPKKTYRLTQIRTTPRTFFISLLPTFETNNTAKKDTARKVSRMGSSLAQGTCLRILSAVTTEVKAPSIPDRAVASPYEGRAKLKTVIAMMPNPKPDTR